MISNNIQEKTISELTNAFLAIGYRNAFVKRNYHFSDFLSAEPTLRTISLAVFGQEPMDYRSACFGLEFTPEVSSKIVANQLRALGAPQIFLIQNGNAEWWVNREKEVVFKENIATRHITKLIEEHSEDWKPEKIMRVKSGFKEPMPQQLDFIDFGLLPALEHQASSKIDSLIGRILYNAEKELEKGKTAFDAARIFNVVFRLLTARLLKDRDISVTPEIDFSHPWDVLNTVAKYYGEDETLAYQPGVLPERLLSDIANEIRRSFSLRNLSVDTLAYVYENTFVSQKSRKKLGIHSTPSYVADYVFAQLPLEDLPRSKWHILDPMCGHGIFLIAAMRKMRNLFPPDWSGRRRHNFFAERLHGIEIDPFSVEVARLCLTLADFPESDGWDLSVEDAFNGEALDPLIDKANIFVGNPPFESIEGMKPETPKPKEILRRILPRLQEGALFGFVLPHSFLDGSDYRPERQMIQESFEIINITTLPDRIFKYSDAETAVLVAKKHSALRMPKTVFRIVREADREQFRLYYKPTFEDAVPSSYFEERVQGRFILPPFRELWERLENNPRLRELADIKTGVEYEPGLLEQDPAQLVQNDPFPNAAPGIFNVTKGFKQFALTDIVYMSTKKEHRRKMVPGAWNLDWNKAKVIVPKSVMSRGPWRFAAAVDRAGLIARRRFFAVWPKEKALSVEFLAAVLNSPVAQAFAFAHSNKRDIPKRVYDYIPIPTDYKNSIQEVNDLVKQYLKVHGSNDERAKELIIEIDFEILRLYDLPRRLTKRLLAFFSGYQRPVPFVFRGYDLDNFLITNLKPKPFEISLTHEQSDFCAQKGLTGYLKNTIDIIFESFPPVKSMRCLLEQDPETGEKWLLIDVAMDSTTEEVLSAYDKYLDQWISVIPASARESIRLSYRIF
ncbi:putative N-6 DNA methylase [uncultured Desulfobacterium sp.]|uniref:site-specific DNA-methyltransferase (adenine-specific) n=1 Tax=uncultured Desulfobacterium sp. TaxID=201089 RepID=A0A445MRC2_9BACT|nr:putative N-6 DNA methylase [uncultured Desulfobacterium sp.]